MSREPFLPPVPPGPPDPGLRVLCGRPPQRWLRWPGRRTTLITVPRHGYVIVAWKGPAGLPSRGRPPIAAVGPDGGVLTVLAPGEHLDSLTVASLEDAVSPPAGEDAAR